MASTVWTFIGLTLFAFTARSLPLSGVADCEFALRVDIPKSRDPVISVLDSGRMNLALPNADGLITVKANQELLFSCPGGGNYLKPTGTNSSTGVCRTGKRVTLDDKDYACCKEMVCNQWATPIVIDTGKKCASAKGYLLQLGYQTNGGWIELVESCHNVEASNTYYSKHRVEGSALTWRMRGISRPKFRRGGDQYYSGFNPDKAFSRDNQAAVIAAIVGEDSVGKYLVPEKNLFMAKGHMAPDGDFLMPSWQSATFFFINVAPQWQTINGGHWNTQVETAVRKLAIKLSADFEVVTGTHGVMTLEGIEMALGPNGRLPVPDLYWKVVTYPATGACTVLLSTNNPFLDKPPLTICPDICREVGWPINDSDIVQGYVYCCDYEAAKRAIPTMPEMVCNSLLKYK